jgi:peroxiredoxin
MGPGHRSRLSILLLPLCLVPVTALAEARRPQNQHEVIYYFIAKEIGAPELCARISPLAEHGLGLNPPGYQIYYTRSHCYLDVAVRTGNAKLCDEVRSLSTPFVDGSKISRAECLKSVGHPEQLINAGPGANFFDAKPILTQMGYTQEMIPAQIVRSNPDEAFMWHAFYKSIATTPDFRHRLGRLPDFSQVAGRVSTLTCGPHFIPAKRPFPPPDDETCCPDFDRNGRCDDRENAANNFNMEDLAIEPVEGKPSPILCGDQPLEIEVRLRNTGRQTAHHAAGWVEIINLNPLLFGLSKADLQIPIPEIGPGGEATVTFPPMKLDLSRGERDRLNLDPRVATAKGESYARFIDLHIEAEATDSPRCAAEQALRNNPASYGGQDRRKRFASGANVDVKFPKEWPLVPIREGEPFELKVEVHNRGSAPVAAGSGVVLLGGEPGGLAIRAADLIRPLPAVAAGGTGTITFPGLVYRGPRSGPHPGYTQLTAVLCMREGCSRVAYLGKQVLKEGEAAAAVSTAPAVVAAVPAVFPGAPARGRESIRHESGADVLVVLSPLDSMSTAVVGHPAPDFSAQDLEGRSHRLRLLLERTRAVLVFIRGASSPACRRQLQEIQQHLEEFRRLGAEVLVLSSAPADLLKAMRSDLGLDLTILRDARQQVAPAFGRPESPAGTLPMVVIVDRNGTVRFKTIASTDAARPSSARLLSVLKDLQAPAPR